MNKKMILTVVICALFIGTTFVSSGVEIEANDYLEKQDETNNKKDTTCTLCSYTLEEIKDSLDGNSKSSVSECLARAKTVYWACREYRSPFYPCSINALLFFIICVVYF